MVQLSKIPEYAHGLAKYPRVSKSLGQFSIMTIENTLVAIRDQGLSMARFGDGELRWLTGDSSAPFQKPSADLSKALNNTLVEDRDRCLVCLPSAFSGLSDRVLRSQIYWRYAIGQAGSKWSAAVPNSREYGNADCTRFYMTFAAKRPAVVTERVELWSSIFSGRDLLVVEGSGTRMGLGNNLFQRANSVARITVPNKNAFDRVQDIQDCIIQHASHDSLILLAIGPTATVLASELSVLSFQALDVGHLDLEYEWMKIGARHKVKVSGRIVTEVGGNDIQSLEGLYDSASVSLYQEQIIDQVF